MLDPVWLRSFLAVADTGGFSEAARRLCLGQSTVSQHVRRLEQVTGRLLFIRDTHSVTLTGDGEALTGFARNILDQERLAMAYFARPELRGKVRLGVCEDLVLGHLPVTLRRFRATYPLVDLELSVELSSVLHDRLAAGGLDLVLAKRRTEADGTLLWREPLVWVGRPGLRLTEGEPVPLVVYPEPSLTRARALEALRAGGLQWRIGCWSDRLNGLRAAALAGLGVAVFARSVVPEGLVPVEAGLPPLAEVDFAVLGGRRAGHGPAAALAELITSARWPQ